MKRYKNIKKIFLYLSLCTAWFIVTNKAVAQSKYSVSGALIDSLNLANKLENARALVLNGKDSILIDYGMAKADGSFVVKNLPIGEFILMVTYPGYADYVQRFTIVDTQTNYDFKNIYLTSKARILSEVIIKGRSAITISGDTTEFNAERFVIQPNAKVEDLLKQLPGIEVDRDGKVRAQGQSVGKFLVDGEEFFGDDPTLVTRNIRGDMVDKIQLFDKKSDQSTLTGIDDGKTTKAINVVLKQDSKRGYFGNGNVGYSPNKLYEAQLMLNAFKDKRKIALYGNLATTGKTGPDFVMGNKFGTVPTSVSTVDGITGFFDELEGTGTYNGRGFPLARTSGAHYDNKWDEDKESINTNYRIGSVSVDGFENTLSQKILPENVTITKVDNTFSNNTFRQKGDVSFQSQLSPTSALKVVIDASQKENRTTNKMMSIRLLESGSPFTQQDNTLSSVGRQKSFSASLTWTKKVKKQGRALNLTANHSQGIKEADNYQNAANRFYNNLGFIDATELVDRYQMKKSNDMGFNTSLTFSESLSSSLAMYLSYGAGMTKSTLSRLTFDKSPSGNYDNLNAELSNNLDYRQIYNQASMTFNYRKKKSTLNWGANLYDVSFHQRDLQSNEIYKRAYLNLIPQLTYQYSIAKQQTLRFSYTANPTQPTISQLQPIKLAEDPLNVILGNPNLRPAYSNRFNVNLNSYKPLNSQNVYLAGNFVTTSNPFATSYNTDARGVTTILPVNISDKASSDISLSAQVSRKLKKIDSQLGLNFTSSVSTGFDVINEKLNERKTRSHATSISFSKEKLEKYSILFKFAVTYSNTSQTIQNLKDYNIIYNSTANFLIYLPGKTEANIDLNYTRNTGSAAFSGTINPFIVNTSLSKKFLKDEGLKLSITGNNLLDQNPGYVRRPNYQNTYTTIRRYFLLSVTWDFSNMGSKDN